MEVLGLFIPLTVMSILAFWKLNSVLFLVTAGIAMMTGLYAPDTYISELGNFNMGMGVGLMLIVYSFICLAFCFMSMFKSATVKE